MITVGVERRDIDLVHARLEIGDVSRIPGKGPEHEAVAAAAARQDVMTLPGVERVGASAPDQMITLDD